MCPSRNRIGALTARVHKLMRGSRGGRMLRRDRESDLQLLSRQATAHVAPVVPVLLQGSSAAV